MKIIAQSFKMKGDLDDNYTLFENGEILHEYDRHRYPGGYNLNETLTPEQISNEVKMRLLNSTSEEKKAQVRGILGL